MTENESKAFLEIEKQCINRNCDRNCAKCDIVQKVEDLNSAYDTAIKALEEVQQYRQIGRNAGHGKRSRMRRKSSHLTITTEPLIMDVPYASEKSYQR